ncbi:MAG: tetratricopeptide repeat protein [Planctomycetaceae bacterium]
MPLLYNVLAREKGLADIYRADAMSAFQAGNQDLAVICFERMVRMRPMDKDRFDLAIWLEESGHNERSQSIINSLAPPDKRGYGPAHLYRARKIMQRTDANLDTVVEAINHLIFARDALEQNGEVDYLLASCYWATGSVTKAVESLREASDKDPKYFYDLFKAYQGTNLQAHANTAASRAAEYFRTSVAENPRDRVARQRYVEVLVWLNAISDVERVISQGVDVDPEGQWQQTLSQAFVAFFRRQKTSGVSLDELLTLLEKAMDADPDSAEAVKELADVGVRDPSGRIDQMLENILTTGRHNAIVHFVLGSRFYQNGNLKDGVFHMKRAYELDNRLSYAANNLAYTELLRENGDANAGLALIEDILSKFPENRAFRETRGQLLAKLGQWEEALNDLEFALVEFPHDPKLHTALATCYHHLGQDALSTRHEALAKSLNDSAEKDPTPP